MTFCRMCGTELDLGERYCHRCGTRVETTSVESYPTAQIKQVSSVSRSQRLIELWRKFSPIILLIGLILFALHVLVGYITRTPVTTGLLDEIFRVSILSELRLHPADYYPIADHFFRQYYAGGGPTFSNDFPAIFYLWLLAPNIAEVKWLYLPFALAGVIASYVAVYAVTKQSVVAFFSGVWMSYFFETDHFLTYEYWAISILLIGLAFFFMNRHVPAAVAVGITSLLKEVFAPFLVIASLYYLIVSRKDWWPFVSSQVIEKHQKTRTAAGGSVTGGSKLKEAVVWTSATCMVGLLWYVNGFVSTGGRISLARVPFSTPAGFEPQLLSLLFAPSPQAAFFRNPAGSTILPLLILMALIGMAFLGKDQSIIIYTSFLLFPLLIPFGVVTLVHGKFATAANIPQRWIAMSIAMLNLLWLTGLYKICERIYLTTAQTFPRGKANLRSVQSVSLGLTGPPRIKRS